MNLRQIARLLAGFTLFFSLSFLVPLIVSLSDESAMATTAAFGIAFGIGVGVAVLLWFAGRGGGDDFFRREGLSVVGLAWLLTGTLAAIPFTWTGALPSFVDACFESISGLTTTGATVLGAPNRQIESLPQSLLLWRAMLQWMGGLGIVLVFIVVLPRMGVTGSRLLSSEQVGGVSDDSSRPRMVQQARLLLYVYTVLTTAAGLAYWLVGLRPFDALCHAMTTIATAGFSNNNHSIGGYDNVGVELVAIVFMFLAGCNFLLLARALTRTQRASPGSLLHSTEFRVYLGLTLVIATGMTLSLWSWGEAVHDDGLGHPHDYGSFAQCLRYASFQTVAILTTTGYSTANFEFWPKLAIFLLVLSMFIGGCTGSTAGGFKMLRAVVCAKLVRYALRHFVRPRSVETLKVGSDVIPNRVVSAILALLLLWIAGVVIGMLALSLDPRLDLVSAFSTSLSMMSCIGPSIAGTMQTGPGAFELVGEIDVGPYGGYGALYPGAKLLMATQMILGRLEILAPLALLTPGFWRK